MKEYLQSDEMMNQERLNLFKEVEKHSYKEK